MWLMLSILSPGGDSKTQMQQVVTLVEGVSHFIAVFRFRAAHLRQTVTFVFQRATSR